MAFGTLIITDESGEVQEYELTKPTTSAGRQPGNDIVLATAAVSRYHATFDVAEGQVFVVDLGTVNGTFVNDRQIEPNSRVELSEGDVIIMGDMRLQFRSAKAKVSPASLEAVLAPSTTTVEDSRVPIRLVIDDPQQGIPPGARLQLAMIIHNKSEFERMFTIEVSGMPPDWAKCNRREVRLDVDEQTEVLISIRPPRSSDTRPGVYPLRILVAFKDDPTQVVEAVRDVHVLEFGAFALAAQEGQKPGVFHVAAQNQGNAPLDVQLGGYHPARALRYHFEPGRLRLAAGETQQVTLTVQTGAGARIPEGRRVGFAIVARSLDPAGYQAPLLTYYTAAPASLPLWLAGISFPLILLGVLAAIVLVVALVFFDVISVPFLSTQIDRLQDTAVSGSNGPVPIASVVASPTSAPATIISPLVGSATPMVSITAFTATPDEATFGVVESIVFAWQVDTGEITRLALYEETSGQQIPVAQENWDTGITIPLAELAKEFGWQSHTYVLTIAGSDNLDRSWPVTVNITPVICTLTANAVILPTPRGNPPPTPIAIPAPPDVVVEGRTANGVWARIWDHATHSSLGWVSVGQIVCPLDPPMEDYLVLPPDIDAPSP